MIIQELLYVWWNHIASFSQVRQNFRWQTLNIQMITVRWLLTVVSEQNSDNFGTNEIKNFTVKRDLEKSDEHAKSSMQQLSSHLRIQYEALCESETTPHTVNVLSVRWCRLSPQRTVYNRFREGNSVWTVVWQGYVRCMFQIKIALKSCRRVHFREGETEINVNRHTC